MHIGFVFYKSQQSKKREKLIGVNIKVGGKAEILKKEYPKCNFDDWFKERGVKLFAVKKPTDKALFEPTKRPQLDAVQYSYEVYCKVLDNPKMTNEEVFKTNSIRNTLI